jgi:hypothetical protein
MVRHKIKSENIQQDTTIRLRFEGGGWATMSFQYFEENDWWQVSINSDWGNWSYSWSRSGMGKDIFNFMAERDGRDYLVSKFTSQEPDYFNAEKSAKKVRKDIREELNYWDDREKFEELIERTKELEDYDSHDIFFERLWDNKELNEITGDCPHGISSYLVFETHPRTKYFFKNIFPKFFKHIKRLAREQ